MQLMRCHLQHWRHTLEGQPSAAQEGEHSPNTSNRRKCAQNPSSNPALTLHQVRSMHMLHCNVQLGQDGMLLNLLSSERWQHDKTMTFVMLCAMRLAQLPLHQILQK